MSNFKTGAEAKKECMEKMGEELGKLYNGLWQEVASLHGDWEEYVVLFGTKPSRIELMNKTAPDFFNMLQRTLFENTMLHISRLTDNAIVCGKKTLSVKGLSELIVDENLKTKVNLRVEDIIRKAEFCRDRRNRKLAHRDLKLAVDKNAEPLPLASRLKIKEVLSSIREVLNAISLYYQDSQTLFDMAGNTPGGATSLLYALDDALKYDQERKIRLVKREFREGDLDSRDI